MHVGYARVSTEDQKLEIQQQKLKQAGWQAHLSGEGFRGTSSPTGACQDAGATP
jgi:DNA invertase Pin-like site-specific DNA recombinase